MMQPFYVTLKLAGFTTLILIPLGLLISAWMYNRKGILTALVRAVIHIPLLLPPSVMGFYLLLAWSPRLPVGNWSTQHLGLRLLFTFPGLLIASILIHFPFMINPLVEALQALPPSLAEAAQTLGKNSFVIFIKVLLPNIKSSLMMACIFTFTHSMGELGVALMIGGKIPGETQTASIAIYDAVEAMEYTHAHLLSLWLCGMTLSALILLFTLRRPLNQSLK